MKKNILGFNKQKIGEITLVKELVDEKISQGCLYYKYLNENSNMHIGTAFKKNRSLVAGGGAKPWRQKGTGRARAGTRSSCIFVHGGQAFGNQRKKYKFHLPRKIKKKGIIILFNIKFKQDLITIIDNIKLKTEKLKEFTDLVKNLIDLKEKVILLVNRIDENLKKAVRNIENITLMSITRPVVRNFINNKKIFITRDAAEYLNTVSSHEKTDDSSDKKDSKK